MIIESDHFIALAPTLNVSFRDLDSSAPATVLRSKICPRYYAHLARVLHEFSSAVWDAALAFPSYNYGDHTSPIGEEINATTLAHPK